eukprot:TRINITY_DN12929_c0_g1_i1.p1 TRINITY_DN12929_c0_g1~~TRINITY_DN12929_c0_g1_i1.p1  ORF type:complete len:1238 (+),score=176.43 TRINITY_DN12929_c0_g1_i1:1183-4896(+)
MLWSFLHVLFFSSACAAPAVLAPGKALYFWSNSIALVAPFTPANLLADATGFTWDYWLRSHPGSYRPVVSLAMMDGPDNSITLGSAWFQVLGVDFGTPTAPPESLSDGKWHHYAWVFNDNNVSRANGTSGDKQVVELFVDGTSSWQGTAGSAVDLRQFSAPNRFALVLGMDQDRYLGGLDGYGLRGHLDELRFWTSALSPAALRQTAGQLELAQKLGLAASWSFDLITESEPLWLAEDSGDPALALLCLDYTDYADGYLYETAGLYGSSPDEMGLAINHCVTRYPPKLAPSEANVFSSAYNSFTVVLFSSAVATRFTLAAEGICQLAAFPPLPSSGVVQQSGQNISLSSLFQVTLRDTATYATLLFVPANASTAQSVLRYEAKSGASSTAASVHFFPNTPPVCSSLTAKIEVNKDYEIIFPASDVDSDPIRVVLLSVPEHGELLDWDGSVITSPRPLGGSGLYAVFRPTPGEFGPDYATFQFAVRGAVASDGENAAPDYAPLSAPCDVSLTVLSSETNPVLSSPLSLVTQEDSALDFSIDLMNPEDTAAVVTISTLPPNGVVYHTRAGQQGTALSTLFTVLQEVRQYATEVIGFSTESSPSPDLYSTASLLGEPDGADYYPSTDVNCTNAQVPDSQGVVRFFFSEWVHVRFATPVYPTAVVIYEADDTLGSTVRLRGRNLDTGEWVTLWSVPEPESPEFHRKAWAPTICQPPFRLRELRVDFDTCHLPGWKGFDALELRGTEAATPTVFAANSSFRFQPSADWSGNTTVGFVFTNCLGNPTRASSVQTLAITVTPVNDPPVAQPVSGPASNQDGIVLNLTGTDIDSTVLTATILSLPLHGTLFTYPALRAITLNYSATAPLSVIYVAKPSETCGTAFRDTFEFDLFDGSLRSVAALANITQLLCDTCPEGFILIRDSCQPCPSGLTWVGPPGSCVIHKSNSWRVVIGVVCGVIGLAVTITVTISLLRRSTRRRRVLSNAPHGDCVAIVFTDIQDSTKLWEFDGTGMHLALAVHNLIIRRAISVTGGYEVKTQGDSFMVAFWDPASAVRFMCESQLQLLHAEWPRELLDHPSFAEKLDKSGRLTSRGFRVRMGCYCGPVDVEFESSTGKVDYFGTTVNAAARIEGLAAGGQCLIGDCVAACVPLETGETNFLGSFPLKGMAQPYEIFEFQPEGVPLREFPRIDPSRAAHANVELTAEGLQPCIRCNRPLRCDCLRRTSKHTGTHVGSSRRHSYLSYTT